MFENLEKGNIPLALFVDHSKSFDSMDHDILLNMLECYEIRDNQLQLIRSYIQGKKQKVVITIDGDSYTSEEINTVLEIPQGSILGPLLFIVYVNSLCCSILELGIPCQPMLTTKIL